MPPGGSIQTAPSSRKAFMREPSIMKGEFIAGQQIAVTPANVDLFRAQALAKLEKLTAETGVFEERRDESYPRFMNVELHLGKVLGRGGFCVVNEIREIRPAKSFVHKAPRYDLEAQDRDFMVQRCVRKGELRYAVKKLADLSEDAARYTKGLADLAIEVKFLAVLEHPHIIKLRGVSDEAPCTDDYFIILDRLGDTLEMRLSKWKKKDDKSRSVLAKVLGSGKKKKTNELLLERMVVAYDLSSALVHMHTHDIIYRDIKPENIGFDIRGDVKIFDLGLAKEILPESALEGGVYNLTGMTGSLRYMSPEVATFKPYNLKADVYSFGILLHQIYSMDIPFRGYNISMFRECVIEKGFRPGVPEKWPESWKALVRSCWAGDWTKRPDMKQVEDTIRNDISALNGGDDANLDLTNRTNNSNGGLDASTRSMAAPY